MVYPTVLTGLPNEECYAMAELVYCWLAQQECNAIAYLDCGSGLPNEEGYASAG